MENVRTRPGSLRAIVGKTPHYLNAINVSESLFAMPFGYIGMVLASYHLLGTGWPGWHTFVWITLAFLGVRTLGMSANRIINAREDARNPRTAGRHIPAGILKPLEVGGMALGGAAIFFIAAWQLNPLALMLSPVAAAYVVLYSFAKYYTWLCSLMLGFALSIAPTGAWIGVTGQWDWQPVLITFAVMMWAGGFETIYGTLDYDFDRANDIKSVASRFGVRNAIRTTRVLHTLAAAALLVVGFWLQLNVFYFIGWAIAVVLLVYENNLVKSGEPAKVGKAFAFNKYISTQLLGFTILAVALPFEGFLPW
ncbi:MAG: 4-hydroxybenzoate octaprenyltransferase [Chloroflexi bacterium]|nr:4-hydroxybenzoate octaprenyltransferase [Chloroflexota bacterium]MYD48043.1 4-hydroxybenzoate octaprenyltransferase [Chloroflexota bacterium]